MSGVSFYVLQKSDNDPHDNIMGRFIHLLLAVLFEWCLVLCASGGPTVCTRVDTSPLWSIVYTFHGICVAVTVKCIPDKGSPRPPGLVRGVVRG